MTQFNEGAPCSLEPDVWLSGKNRNIEKAKAGCAECGIRPMCLEVTEEYELMTGEPRIGIFGGLTEVERIKRRASV